MQHCRQNWKAKMVKTRCTKWSRLCQLCDSAKKMPFLMPSLIVELTQSKVSLFLYQHYLQQKAAYLRSPTLCLKQLTVFLVYSKALLAQPIMKRRLQTMASLIYSQLPQILVSDSRARSSIKSWTYWTHPTKTSSHLSKKHVTGSNKSWVQALKTKFWSIALLASHEPQLWRALSWWANVA